MQYLTTDTQNNLVIGHSRRKLYIFDSNLTEMLSIETGMTNINQIQAIGDYIVVKNTCGEICIINKQQH